MSKRIRWQGLLLLIVAGTLTCLGSHSAWAIPAFKRVLDVKCETCHSPVPPRLNNVGMVFRRMGFRLPDADDKGNLTLKDGESKSVFDHISVIGEMPLTHKSDTGVGEGSTQLSVDEVELRGAGPVDKHFSVATVFELLNDEGAQELETFEAQYNQGTPEKMFTVRMGQILPIIWQKELTNRLTLSTPLALVNQAAVGHFAGFKPKRELRGVEFGYNLNKLNGGKLTSTFLAGSIFNGVNDAAEGVGGDVDSNQDYMLQVSHLWGEANTVSAFYYNGKTVVDPNSDELDSTTGLPVGGPFAERFNRLGVMGNYKVQENTDLVAGYVWGQDKTTEPVASPSPRSKGYFLELDQALKGATDEKGGVAAMVRYDSFDPDDSVGGDNTSALTFGLAHRASDNVLLNLEYQHMTMTGVGKQNQITASVRFLY